MCDSDYSVGDEKAVDASGSGIRILASIDLPVSSIDEGIEEHHRLPKLKYSVNARALCMKFVYFDKQLQVYSDERTKRTPRKAANSYRYMDLIAQDSRLNSEP